MKYALFPDNTKQMLRLCKPGNFTYEVTVRYCDGSVGCTLSQAKTTEEAEKRALNNKHARAAIAHQIILEVN